MASRNNIIRVAAMADLHYSATSQGMLRQVFSQASDSADILLLCGDLTDTGLPDEAQVLAKDLAGAVKVPMLGIMGNHDYEGGKAEEVWNILCDAGVEMLDGTTREVGGVGFAGVKGFAGGFGRWMLAPWGEKVIKDFVQEAVEETLKLETALLRLYTPQRVVLLHYAPIEATLEGEPREIFPFMGCSRLEEPLNNFPVAVAFHGHAHMGSFEGQTRTGVPVYNVGVQVLQRVFPDRPPFHIMEIPIEEAVEVPK